MNWNKLLKRLAVVIVFLIVIVGSLVAPIDYTPLKDQPYYAEMMQRLDTFQLKKHPASKPLTMVGWSKFSIVPDHPVAMSGYKPRAKFTDVHDTLYARIMTINNGNVTAYFVTVDMLIFPPTLKRMINDRLKPSNSEFLYFNASHTHTGVGGWQPSLFGHFLMGEYQEEWMINVADGIVAHMQLAVENLKVAELFNWQADASKHVRHRLDKSGESPVDGSLRGITILRSDGTKALLYSYGLHPTLISRNETSLSGDYPSEVMASLNDEYAFTQFMAGMMGSQGSSGFGMHGMHDFELTSMVGKSLAPIIRTADQKLMGSSLDIKTGIIKVRHGPSQLRLTENIKLRHWVFEKVLDPIAAEMKILKIGNILFIGTSCDFAGEIFLKKRLGEKAEAHNMQLIITSFNGEYTGYITDDKHYNTIADEEVRGLNWVGPYFGEYYSEIIKVLIKKAAE